MIIHDGFTPSMASNVYIAPGASVIGRVTIGSNTSVWFNAVLRADLDIIEIGSMSNIQDNVTIHVDEGVPTKVGNRVTIGHNAVLHGCIVEDDSLIGMGSIVLNNAVVGKGSLVAAGSLISPDMVIPPGSLVMGTPGKVVRLVSEQQKKMIEGMYLRYMELAESYRS